METKDYVKIFRLDQENFQFNRGEYINKMGEDLLEVCQRQQKINPVTGHIYYSDFKKEVKKAIMAKEIVDLHGNIFKVIKGWEFYNKVPNFEGNYTWIFTRDRITDTQFILALNEELNIAVGYWYSNIYQLYVARPLKRIGYDESKDIRKEYLYNGKRQHKKIS